MKKYYRVSLFVALFVIAVFAASFNAQGPNSTEKPRAEASVLPAPELFAGLKWRSIGPFHGGRISAVTGAIGQPGIYYVGTPAGGVWKTTSAGVTWFPIFDDFQNVDSIGSVQVAPSDPNIVYVGTGDSVQGSSGDGMYRSDDAGRTWKRCWPRAST